MCARGKEREREKGRKRKGKDNYIKTNLVVYEPKSDMKCLVLMEKEGLQAEWLLSLLKKDKTFFL